MMKRGPGARPVLASVVFHVGVLVPMFVFTRAPEPVLFDTIRINLVSMPTPVEATQPAPPPPEPEPEPVVEEPAPEPVAEPPRPEPQPRRPEPQRTEPPPPRPTPPPQRTPPAEPTPGAEGVNIQTEGIQFPFPEYLNNVVIQLHRYFRWTEPGNPRGTIYFEILPDGSVRNIRMVRPSGNLRFDFALQGAVETAGNRGAFGPLPDAFAGASLPVQLEVEPPR
jgi:outer membrane biosynthesis protein TonB